MLLIAPLVFLLTSSQFENVFENVRGENDFRACSLFEKFNFYFTRILHVFRPSVSLIAQWSQIHDENYYSFHSTINQINSFELGYNFTNSTGLLYRWFVWNGFGKINYKMYVKIVRIKYRIWAWNFSFWQIFMYICVNRYKLSNCQRK